MSRAERSLTLPGRTVLGGGRFVPIGVVDCGQLAGEPERRDSWILRTSSITVGARLYKLVSFKGGPWEIYRVTMTGPERGLETFLGYAHEAIRVIVADVKAARGAEP